MNTYYRKETWFWSNLGIHSSTARSVLFYSRKLSSSLNFVKSYHHDGDPAHVLSNMLRKRRSCVKCVKFRRSEGVDRHALSYCVTCAYHIMIMARYRVDDDACNITSQCVSWVQLRSILIYISTLWNWYLLLECMMRLVKVLKVGTRYYKKDLSNCTTFNMTIDYPCSPMYLAYSYKGLIS